MKMFKTTALSLAIVTSACSFAAFAAETAQISVKGAIFPSACSIVVEGAADFGNIKKHDLQQQSGSETSYQLGYKPVNFNIQCSSAVKVALSAQAETPPVGESNIEIASHISETITTQLSTTEQHASLGQLDGKDIGYFTVALASATLDGENTDLLSDEQTNGGTWQKITEAMGHLMLQDNSVLYSWGKDDAPQEASKISGVLNISAAMDPKVINGVKDAINFNSGTTLNLHYL